MRKFIFTQHLCGKDFWSDNQGGHVWGNDKLKEGTRIIIPISFMFETTGIVTWNLCIPWVVCPWFPPSGVQSRSFWCVVAGSRTPQLPPPTTWTRSSPSVPSVCWEHCWNLWCPPLPGKGQNTWGCNQWGMHVQWNLYTKPPWGPTKWSLDTGGLCMHV